MHSSRASCCSLPLLLYEPPILSLGAGRLGTVLAELAANDRHPFQSPWQEGSLLSQVLRRATSPRQQPHSIFASTASHLELSAKARHTHLVERALPLPPLLAGYGTLPQPR